MYNLFNSKHSVINTRRLDSWFTQTYLFTRGPRVVKLNYTKPMQKPYKKNIKPHYHHNNLKLYFVLNKKFGTYRRSWLHPCRRDQNLCITAHSRLSLHSTALLWEQDPDFPTSRCLPPSAEHPNRTVGHWMSGKLYSVPSCCSSRLVLPGLRLLLFVLASVWRHVNDKSDWAVLT